jgi:FkbM family methyltransferase
MMPGTVPAPEDRDDKERRSDFFERAAAYMPWLAVDTAAGSFLVSSADPNVGQSLFVRRRRGEMRVLERGMAVLERLGRAEHARGGVFIDVGANIGTSVIPALRSHGFARGIACEPEARNYRLLRLNLVANQLEDRVRALQVAVSDTCGERGLVIAEYGSGLHELQPQKRRPPKEQVIRVEVVTLDFLVERSLVEADGTGLIWIDTEGHEGQVLTGARRLLEQGVPVVLEINPPLLKRHRGTDLLREVADSYYTHVVDLRDVHGDPASPQGLSFKQRSVERIGSIVDAYRSDGRITEVLLLRAPKKAVREGTS